MAWGYIQNSRFQSIRRILCFRFPKNSGHRPLPEVKKRGDQLNPLKGDPNTARAPLAPTHRIRPVSQPTLPAHVYRTVGSLFTNGQLYQLWSKLCPINCLFLTSVFRLLRTRKYCTRSQNITNKGLMVKHFLFGHIKTCFGWSPCTRFWQRKFHFCQTCYSWFHHGEQLFLLMRKPPFVPHCAANACLMHQLICTGVFAHHSGWKVTNLWKFMLENMWYDMKFCFQTTNNI